MENIEMIAAIAALITALAAFVTIIVTVRNAKKEAFINVVTTARKEYIQELRKSLSEFCSEVRSENPDNKNLKKMGFQLKFMMNPAGYEDWDYKSVKLIEKIINNSNNNDKELKQFVVLMQSWLALEWNGMMTEGKKGVLSDEKKEEIRNKFLLEYQNYCRKEGIEYE